MFCLFAPGISIFHSGPSVLMPHPGPRVNLESSCSSKAGGRSNTPASEYDAGIDPISAIAVYQTPLCATDGESMACITNTKANCYGLFIRKDRAHTSQRRSNPPPSSWRSRR